MNTKFRHEEVIYRGIGFIIAFYVLINFNARVFVIDANIAKELEAVGIFLFLALLCHIISTRNIDNHAKEIFYSISVSAIIFAIDIQNLNNINLIILIAPFFWILIFIIFDSFLAYIIICFSVIISKILVLHLAGPGLIEKGLYCIIAYISIVFFALLINRMITARNRKYLEQVRFQVMLLKLTEAFDAVKKEDFATSLISALMISGHYLEVKSIGVTMINNDGDMELLQYEWETDDDDDDDDDDVIISRQVLSEEVEDELYNLIKDIKEYEIFYVEQLQEKAPFFHEQTVNRDFASVLIFPMIHQNEIVGTLFFKSKKKTNKIEGYRKQFVIMASRVFLNAFIKEKADVEIYRSINYDRLTGLFRYDLFASKIQEKIEIAEENGGLVAVYYVDIDGFKEFNEVMGYTQGDQVLMQTSIILKEFAKELGQ